MRHTFGGDLASWSTDLGDDATSASGQDGKLALFIPGATIAFYDAITGGAQYTDLLDSLGTPITTVTTDTTGEFPQFQGPDEIWHMWADGSGDGSGPRRIITATDLADIVSSNRDTLLGLISTVTDLQTLAASSLGIVEYDTDTTSWPTRPSDSRIYMWVGPSAPPVGGGYMQDGRDFWLSPTPVA